MALSFVAFDFETANSSRASACSLGMTKVVNGLVASKKYELFQPPEGFDNFDLRNIGIHGISPTQVAGKPRFGEIWQEFLDFVDGLPLVAHNASFDMSVLRAALSASDLSWPNLEYACTMVLSRKLFKITSHSLLYVAQSAGVKWDEEKHHDALYDSEICAEILLSMARQTGKYSLSEILESLDLQVGELYSDGWETCRGTRRVPYSAHHLNENRHSTKDIFVNVDADPNHPLYGKTVVFTGKLYSMPRPEAWSLVASLGGIPKDSMSKSTNLLVLGEQDPFKLSPGQTQSAKFREAEKMRSAGIDIEVINETDFLSFIEPEVGKA